LPEFFGVARRKYLSYGDCGVGTFRDIQLGHPVNAIKVVKGKDGYEISLEWKTVEEALDKIMLFAEQVEAYHREKGTWNVSIGKDGMLDVEFDFADLVKDLESERPGRGLQRFQHTVAAGCPRMHGSRSGRDRLAPALPARHTLRPRLESGGDRAADGPNRPHRE
jgi:hypothetical protein